MPSVVVGITATQLTSTSVPVKYQTSVKTAAANTGSVAVGFANTITIGATTAPTTDGYPLAANQERVIPRASADDVNKIWVIATTVSQQVYFDPI